MTVIVSRKNTYQFEWFFNCLVNTDNLNEGIFTLYVGDQEDEYIFSADSYSYRIIK